MDHAMSGSVTPASQTVPAAPPAKATASKSPVTVWGKDGFGFDDLLDIINPLQHIPIVSSIYRSITHDDIGDAAKAAGGLLFGGVPGLVASLADTVITDLTGTDVESRIASVLNIDDAAPDSAVAEAQPQAGGKQGKAGQAPAPDATTTAAADKPAPPFIATPTGEKPFAAMPTGVRPSAAVQPNKAAKSDTKAASTPAFKPFSKLKPLSSHAGKRQLPPPQVLAQNPRLISSVRRGESAYFRPGGTVSSDAWLRLIDNSATRPGPNGQLSGTKALATGTIAKALASYGRAGALSGNRMPANGQGQLPPSRMAIPQLMTAPIPLQRR